MHPGLQQSFPFARFVYWGFQDLGLHTRLDHVKWEYRGPGHDSRQATAEQHFQNRLSVGVGRMTDGLLGPLVRPKVPSVPKGVTQACYPAAVVEAGEALARPDVAGNGEGRGAGRRGDLDAALDQFGGSTDYEGGEPADGTGAPHFIQGGGVRRVVVEDGQGAVVRLFSNTSVWAFKRN